MKNLIILSFILLSVVLACHSTCNCDQGSNVCKSCKEASIGAKIDIHQRSCPCPSGWYQDVKVTTITTPGFGPDQNCYELTNIYLHQATCFGPAICFKTQSEISFDQAKSICDAKSGCLGILIHSGGYFFVDIMNSSQGSSNQYWVKKQCSSPPTSTTTFESQCKRLINTDDSGKEIAVEMDACKLEIGLKTKDMKVLTDCHFENIDGKSYVISDIRLDTVNANFNSACLGTIRTKLEYKSPSTHQYIDLPSHYITNNPAGNKTIKIPLIDIYGMCTSQTVNDDQIVQTVNLKIFIGHEDSWVRSHKWDLIVYTNRDQVEIFQIDVDIQETEGCQPGQECIIIADLDTVSDVYTDSTFTTVHNPPHQYKVGDIFYAKIKFADPTYTKRLTFEKLYFKSDQGKIFNFSSITTSSWDGTGLRISLPLVQPSQGAVIQVNMKISTQNARLLSDSEEQVVKSSFVASIYENKDTFTINATDLSQQDSKNSSSMSTMLGMSILSTLLYLLF